MRSAVAKSWMWESYHKIARCLSPFAFTHHLAYRQEELANDSFEHSSPSFGFTEIYGCQVFRTRLRTTESQFSRFSSSNSESVARKPVAAFRLYPARSFMSR
jgi:hypothetical protein